MVTQRDFIKKWGYNDCDNENEGVLTVPALEVYVELGPHEEEVDGLLVAAADGVGERRRAVVRRQVDVHVRHGQQDRHDVRAVLGVKKEDDSITERWKGIKFFCESQDVSNPV